MATRYYRMSSLSRAEAVVRRLETEAGLAPSRPLGYAHRTIVRVDDDHEDRGLDDLVREVDATARPVAAPTD
jgi:hypothetical protein